MYVYTQYIYMVEEIGVPGKTTARPQVTGNIF